MLCNQFWHHNFGRKYGAKTAKGGWAGTRLGTPMEQAYLPLVVKWKLGDMEPPLWNIFINRRICVVCDPLWMGVGVVPVRCQN